MSPPYSKNGCEGMKLFVFGLGYSALATARRLMADGWQVAGTTRSKEKQAALKAQGISAHLYAEGALSPSLLHELEDVTHLLQSIAPGSNGDQVIAGLQAISVPGKLCWIGYYSTVGVYGDFKGEWIDESANCAPVNPRSQARIVAERDWGAYADCHELPLFILRLAGIYGPGRSTFDKLRKGTSRRIIKSGQVFNRIHVDDIGEITRQAARQQLAGIFNGADDEPAPPQDVIVYAAEMLGVGAPPELPFETAEMTPMARSFYADNKRVSNQAIKQALGYSFKFPTYRQGLRSVFEAEAGQSSD